MDEKDHKIQRLERENAELVEKANRRPKVEFSMIKDEDLEENYLGLLRQSLWDATEELKSLHLQMSETGRDVKEAEDVVNAQEIWTKGEVAGEKNLEGKSIFSNVEIREKESLDRLRKNTRYLAALDVVTRGKFKLSNLARQVEVLDFDCKNKRCILDSMPRQVKNQ